MNTVGMVSTKLVRAATIMVASILIYPGLPGSADTVSDLDIAIAKWRHQNIERDIPGILRKAVIACNPNNVYRFYPGEFSKEGLEAFVRTLQKGGLQTVYDNNLQVYDKISYGDDYDNYERITLEILNQDLRQPFLYRDAKTQTVGVVFTAEMRGIIDELNLDAYDHSYMSNSLIDLALAGRDRPETTIDGYKIQKLNRLIFEQIYPSLCPKVKARQGTELYWGSREKKRITSELAEFGPEAIPVLETISRDEARDALEKEIAVLALTSIRSNISVSGKVWATIYPNGQLSEQLEKERWSPVCKPDEKIAAFMITVPLTTEEIQRMGSLGAAAIDPLIGILKNAPKAEFRERFTSRSPNPGPIWLTEMFSNIDQLVHRIIGVRVRSDSEPSVNLVGHRAADALVAIGEASIPELKALRNSRETISVGCYRTAGDALERLHVWWYGRMNGEDRARLNRFWMICLAGLLIIGGLLWKRIQKVGRPIQV